MNTTPESPSEIRTVTRVIKERSWDYPVDRLVSLIPDTSAELRREFATSLAMGAKGTAVYVSVGVKDPVATQFVNVSFRVDSCRRQVSAGHTLEIISGRNTDGTHRTELLFVNDEIKLVTLVATDLLAYDVGQRS